MSDSKSFAIIADTGTKIRAVGTRTRNGLQVIVTVEMEPVNSCPIPNAPFQRAEIKYGIESLCDELTAPDD